MVVFEGAPWDFSRRTRVRCREGVLLVEVPYGSLPREGGAKHSQAFLIVGGAVLILAGLTYAARASGAGSLFNFSNFREFLKHPVGYFVVPYETHKTIVAATGPKSFWSQVIFPPGA